ncbi:hypothetical protein D1646_12435 [Pseudoflavonifractor sp. 60]|uniref:HTH domain-containing protein n=1 Tax=Pseudoflavonifractor sp. 60 TaxID=2304576 RepID=UPI00136F1395|nr:HTH domain-containing protein [Pseudoflavonifractor sp. 60]NBI67602.1 hypothetical protein [Pseudoflavonifractor sp. 60]
MERKLKLGFIGTYVRMELIRNIVPKRFPELQIEIFENDRYDYYEEMAQTLLELKSRISGVIFGGELQFKQYQKLFEPDIPCGFIEKDSVSLLNSLVSLSWQRADITRVSIDNYSPSTVRKVFEDAGIPDNHVHILKKRYPKRLEDNYFDTLHQGHRKLFLDGAVAGCIATDIQVYERLAADGIPAAYSRPTTDNIVRTVSRMKQECMERAQMETGNLAVLALRITPKEEIFYQAQREYLESHEKLKAAEELYYFAKDARAAVMQQSDESFIILMNRKDLMIYSNCLESLPFLHLIQDNSACNVSLGIGYGYTPGEAKANAGLALKKAGLREESCTYIVHNINSITGPVNFVRPQNTKAKEERERMRGVVARTGISAVKLQQLTLLVEQTKKSLFTAADLAEHLHISLRSANRLLASLEENGLACLSGQAVTGTAGRPGNIYRLLVEHL